MYSPIQLHRSIPFSSVKVLQTGPQDAPVSVMVEALPSTPVTAHFVGLHFKEEPWLGADDVQSPPVRRALRQSLGALPCALRHPQSRVLMPRSRVGGRWPMTTGTLEV